MFDLEIRVVDYTFDAKVLGWQQRRALAEALKHLK